jgi:hypothetical protein
MLSHRKLVFRSALVAGLALFSGTASALDFGAGPLVGLNLANASFEAPTGIDAESGILTRFAFGARAEFGVTSPFSLLLEPQYLQRGAAVEVKTPGFAGKGETRYNYLELPILAKAKFGSMKAHAYAFAGPSLGLYLNGESEFEGDTMDEDSAASFNFSGDVGVGGAYQIQEFIYLNADVRYSHGFLNVNRDEKSVEDLDWFNRDIRFQLCLLFHLTK